MNPEFRMTIHPVLSAYTEYAGSFTSCSMLHASSSDLQDSVSENLLDLRHHVLHNSLLIFRNIFRQNSHAHLRYCLHANQSDKQSDKQSDIRPDFVNFRHKKPFGW